MNKFLSTIFVALLCLKAFAVPARRTPFTVWTSDSTKLTVTLVGDETFHFLATLDGIPVVKDGEGYYRLAPELKTDYAETWKSRLARRNAPRLAKAAARRAKVRRTFGYPSVFVGQKKGLVILLNFADKAMKTANNQAAWNNQFNQLGYSKNGCIGSVHDYFYDQSYGKFDIEFDVVGPVTVSKGYAYYGKNSSDGDDMYPATMVAEACRQADKQGVNFADYDWDGDGEVDMVYVVFAGCGEHVGNDDNAIWPHEWELSSGQYYGDGTGPLKLDGVTIDTYAVSGELRSSSGSTMDGIGTACHEFSHCLGLPDMYDTSYSGGFGMNSWDVLDNGSYNGPSGYGEVPSGFTAYERNFAGWLDFTELSEDCTITDMPALQDSPVAYIIHNDGNPNEAFILENRQNRGWFKYVDSATTIHGMLIYHQDYDEEAWVNNEVNLTADHQRMSIIPAGKSFGKYNSSYGMYTPTIAQYASQLFPGTKSVTELTSTSHEECNGKLFNKNTDGTYHMNMTIIDIQESNGLISFQFKKEEGGTPVETDPYFVEETMSKMTFTSDQILEILNYDLYFEATGWNGSKVYGSNGKVKLASGSNDAKLTSPLIQPGDDGTVTVTANAANYRSDLSILTVRILNENDTKKAEQEVKLTDNDVDYTFDFAGVNYPFKVQFFAEKKKRYYINRILILTDKANAIGAVETDADTPTEYFTLSGIRVTSPTTKGVYIVRQNGATRKVFIR